MNVFSVSWNQRTSNLDWQRSISIKNLFYRLVIFRQFFNEKLLHVAVLKCGISKRVFPLVFSSIVPNQRQPHCAVVNKPRYASAFYCSGK